jgi:hypothetical protein
VVCELLNRLKANRHFEVALPEFQRRVRSINALLKDECQKSQNAIVFRKHGQQVHSLQSLKPDGTYLNEYGMEKLHDSIYRAFWLQLQQVIGKV